MKQQCTINDLLDKVIYSGLYRFLRVYIKDNIIPEINKIKLIFKIILKLFFKSINNEIKTEIKELKYINLPGI